MKAPAPSDRVVTVRGFLTDERFGYEHWRAAQFGSPAQSTPGILLLYETEAERNAALRRFEHPDPEKPA